MATSRRSFLVGAGKVMVLLPAGYAFANMVGCGGDKDSATDSCDLANDVTDNGTTLVVTSECSDNHVHNFTIQDGDIATPPAAGVSGSTSTSDGHTHTVTLTEGDLAAIKAGNTVTKTTGETESHTHTFNFSTTPSSSAQQSTGGYGY